MEVVKDKEEKRRENRTKESPRTGVRPQIEQTALLASPIYIGQAQGRNKKHIKKGAKAHALSLSPECWRAPPLSSFHILSWHALTP